MNETLKYKGYVGSVEYDPRDKILHGRVLGIKPRIIYEGTSVEELENDFQNGIDHYLKVCQKKGREPEKPFSGQFTIRLDPDLHCAAWRAARRNGSNLTGFVRQVLESATGYHAAASEDTEEPHKSPALR